MSPERRAFFAVDRFEHNYVVLIGDDGTPYDVTRSALPPALREGSVLSVRLADDGQPVWSDARPDLTEYQRRLDHARKQLGELKRRDPGGDITL
jgi:hypothetical protein